VAQEQVDGRTVVQGTQGNEEGHMEGPLQDIQRAVAREATSTEIYSGKADRTGRREDHGSIVGDKGESEWDGGLCTCCMGQ